MTIFIEKNHEEFDSFMALQRKFWTLFVFEFRTDNSGYQRFVFTKQKFHLQKYNNVLSPIQQCEFLSATKIIIKFLFIEIDNY